MNKNDYLIINQIISKNHQKSMKQWKWKNLEYYYGIGEFTYHITIDWVIVNYECQYPDSHCSLNKMNELNLRYLNSLE